MAIEIDNDNNEIRIDGYEYAATKVSSKSYGISSESSQTGNSADLRLTGSDSSTDNVTFTGGPNVTVVRTDANKITISASANDTNTTYGISAETNAIPKSADIRLTGSDSTTDNLTLVGGTNVTVTRTDVNTITLSASTPDTNTTYGISAETNAAPKSADIRLTGSDNSTDNLTLAGGTNVNVTRTDANTITLSSSDTNTTYAISAEPNAAPKSADIRLTGSDNSTDNLTLVGGTNVTVTRTDANTITLSSLDTNITYGISAEASGTGNSSDLRLTGSNATTDNVTITGGSGISIVTSSADKMIVSVSESSIILESNITLLAPPGTPNLTSFFSIPSLNGNETVELRGVILLKFNGQGANTIQFTLATSGTFNYAGINIQVGNTNPSPTTAFVAQVGEVTSSNIGIQTASISDTNVHTVSISGVIRNGASSASPSLNINNMSSTNTLTILAKSFIKYNKI